MNEVDPEFAFTGQSATLKNQALFYMGKRIAGSPYDLNRIRNLVHLAFERGCTNDQSEINQLDQKITIHLQLTTQGFHSDYLTQVVLEIANIIRRHVSVHGIPRE